MGEIYIGTSGFSYKEWKEVLYAGVKSADYLSTYANSFNALEINSTFYRLPSVDMLQGWVGKVPAQFKFCPKMSNYLTHNKRLREPEDSLEKIFGRLQALGQKMGPVLIQLPPTLGFDYEVVEHFYKVLQRDYRAYEFAIEPRHADWLTTDSIGLMQRYHIAFVIAQSGTHYPYAEMVTSRNMYVRLHGPDEMFKSGYNDEMLEHFAGLCRGAMADGLKVWFFFNNTWGVNALKNAATLKQMLDLPA